MRHVAAFDGIRAIAVLEVVAFHVGHLRGIALGGFLGVDVFFVLSSFLITSLLAVEHEETGGIAYARFGRRRLARLAPALLLFLAVYLAAAPTLFPTQGATENLTDALIAGAYLSDYSFALAGVPDTLRHTWSLAVEAHFYLLWPIVVPILLRSRKPLHILAVAYGASVAWKVLSLTLGTWDQAYYRFDTRLSGLMAGAFLALLLRRPGPQPVAWLFHYRPVCLSVALAGAAMLVARFGDARTFVAGGMAAELATVLLIGSIVLGTCPPRWAAMLSSRPAQVLGKLSYGIYLWHFPISLVLRDRMAFVPAFIATLGLSIAFAAVSYVTVEAVWRSGSRRKPQAPARKPGVVGGQVFDPGV